MYFEIILFLKVSYIQEGKKDNIIKKMYNIFCEFFWWSPWTSIDNRTRVEYWLEGNLTVGWERTCCSSPLSRYPVTVCLCVLRRRKWHFPFFESPACHSPTNTNHSLPIPAAKPRRRRRSSGRRWRGRAEPVTSLRPSTFPRIRSQSTTDNEESFTSSSCLRFDPSLFVPFPVATARCWFLFLWLKRKINK